MKEPFRFASGGQCGGKRGNEMPREFSGRAINKSSLLLVRLTMCVIGGWICSVIAPSG